MDLLLTIVYYFVGACFAAAAIMATIRIVRGPSIVDRMVGSDTFATILICVFCADMAIRGHTTTLPLVLGLAMTASVGTIAVARFVSRDRPRQNYSTDTEAELDVTVPAGNTKPAPEANGESSKEGESR
ncbi:sodium:proton antiporter [Gulosibacter molinativorax]|uniref:Sodium:proton antiporter n=2 Tax=Gulosibacter molinativorax TaxID=256821 RepID=A0ABT7C9Q7_9MICO|nr:sodium:proton antiporter [Gulosibacter molinativorax]QUY62579.1 Multisubunit Na+/H+ antiporter, CPA3 family [Gulosibacter molinativorax]